MALLAPPGVRGSCRLADVLLVVTSSFVAAAAADGADVRVAALAVSRVGRRFAVARRGIGSGEITWDGRTGGGAPVGSGVYFVRLRAGDEVCTRKLVRTR